LPPTSPGIGTVAAHDIFENSHQIAIVIYGQCAGRPTMRTRSFHLPKRDVSFVRGAIGLGRDKLREHNEESISIRNGDPVEFFRLGLRRAADPSQHKDDCGMSRGIWREMNQIGTAVAIVREPPRFGLAGRKSSEQ